MDGKNQIEVEPKQIIAAMFFVNNKLFLKEMTPPF